MYHDIVVPYFKDEAHEILFKKYLERLNFNKYDSAYVVYCYLAAATNKESLLYLVSHSGIDGIKILQLITVYSSSERGLIKLALHLFNPYRYKQENIDLLMSNLDESNKKCVLTAFKIRFKINI